jgi:DNA repair ATPase RecN
MKPINEKERTLAFIQFLVLSVMAIVLFMFVVFFNYNLKWKENKVLKEEIKRLKGNQTFSTDFPLLIDSLRNEVNDFKKLTAFDYNLKNKRLNTDLSVSLLSLKEDTSNLAQTKSEILKVIQDWSYDVEATISQSSNITELKSLKKQLEEKQASYDAMEKEYKLYMKTHP